MSQRNPRDLEPGSPMPDAKGGTSGGGAWAFRERLPVARLGRIELAALGLRPRALTHSRTGVMLEPSAHRGLVASRGEKVTRVIEKLKSVIVRYLWRVPPRLFRAMPTRVKSIRLMRAYTDSVWAHPRPVVAHLRTGQVFHGDTRDVIQRNIYTHGVWEPEITDWLERYVRKGDLVVDVGANTGYFSLLASHLVGPEGLVFAVEPVPSISTSLIHNLAANRCTNVRVFNRVASDASGDTEIYRASEENIGNSSTVAEPGHVSEGLIESVRLDDLLQGIDDSLLRVVKIDTEGDEAKVLAGMPRILAAMPSGSAVLVEVTPDKLALRGATEHDVWRFFPKAEWAPHRINNDYLLESYLAKPTPPQPIEGPLGERADLIFVKR